MVSTYCEPLASKTVRTERFDELLHKWLSPEMSMGKFRDVRLPIFWLVLPGYMCVSWSPIRGCSLRPGAFSVESFGTRAHTHKPNIICSSFPVVSIPCSGYWQPQYTTAEKPPIHTIDVGEWNGVGYGLHTPFGCICDGWLKPTKNMELFCLETSVSHSFRWNDKVARGRRQFE